MTLQGLIDAAIFIAGVQNSDAQAESLVPIVFQSVALKYAGTEEGRSLPLRSHTIALTSGAGAVPTEALTACKFGASISSGSDPAVGQTQTIIPYFQDFIQPRNRIDAQLNWWTIQEDRTFLYLAPEEEYPGSFTGNLELLISTVPEVPAAPGDTIDAPGEFLSDAVQALAIAIKASNQVAA